jgi:arylsulfatase A-like enzyme
MTDHQRGDTVLPEHPAITPHLKAFAGQGVTFTNAFCPSPHCCPSRATFHSGLYPSRHGVWNNVSNAQALSLGLKEGVRLWSEDLAEAGYDLVWAGKWHISAVESPKDRGWREFSLTGQVGVNSDPLWNEYRQLAQAGEPTQRAPGQMLRPGYGPVTLYGRRDEGNPGDERSARQVIDALPQLAAGGKPWAAFIGCQGPHDPYTVPQRYLDLYDLDKIPLPPSYADELADKPRIYKRMRNAIFDQLSEREVCDAIRHFWAYCTYLDDLFGQVLAALEATGQADNTLVVYTSDHGDYCGEHGLFAKGIPCFRGAYNVPAILRWPAGIKQPARREEAFITLADFAPTFLELAGVKTERPLTGRSLAPFMQADRPAGWPDDVHTQCNGVELYCTQRSVMTRDFKYIFNGFDDDELYDLRSDRDEMVNVSARPEYQQIKRDMLGRMWRFACREGDTATRNYITVGLAPWGPAEAFRKPT